MWQKHGDWGRGRARRYCASSMAALSARARQRACWRRNGRSYSPRLSNSSRGPAPETRSLLLRFIDMTDVHRRNATALAALRIFVGIFFLLYGEYKVFGTQFTLGGGFEESIGGFLAQGTYPWMAPVLRQVILPHAHLFAFLTAYGELLIGLGLVFGVLTRVASVFGMMLMILLWLSAGYPGPHVALWRY